MRLTRLTLRQYGSFADASLRLEPAPGRINLVLAPNGAGKSVLRQAFGDLFFGIGGQTPMGFRHGYPGMQVLAEGIGPDGAPFVLDRRKKVGAAALLGADGQPLAPSSLTRLTGPADRALLERLFALDTEKLRAGGQALLASGGALAEALLQAAGGMRQARDLRQALEGERDRLAPRRKSAQRPFYLALDRLTSSRRLLKDKLVRPEAWLQQDEALAEATRRHEAAHQAARDAAAAIHRMERARRIRPLLARLDMARAWLDRHPDAPHLPPDLRDRLSAALRGAEQASEALAGLRRRHAELLQQAAAVQPDAALLAAAEDIRILQEDAGAAGKAQKDLPAVEAALRAREARVEEHLAALGLPGPASKAAAQLPAPLPVQQARRLTEAHARHAALLAELPGRIATQQAALAAAAQELERLPPVGTADDLSALLTAILAEGDPVRLATAAATRVAQARAKLGAELARLPAPLRDPAILRTLSLPARAELERLAATRDAAVEAVRRAEAELSRLEADGRQVLAERAALEGQGSLPDEAALQRARARRDEGWHLVYRRAFMPAAVDEAAERAFARAEPLPLAYARAVAEADALADQRLLETARLARAAELDRATARNRAETEAAATVAEAARAAAVEAGTRWEAAIRPAGLGAMARWPEVEALLTQRDVVLDAAQVVEHAEAEAAQVEARHRAGALRLARALRLEDATGPDLRTLLDMAESRQRAAHRDLVARADLTARRDAAARALEEARRDHRQAEERLSAWEAEWREAWRALGHDASPSAEDGSVLLDLYEALRGLVAQAGEARERLEGMRAEIAGFGTACLRICQSVQPDALVEDAFAAARALAQRLGQEAEEQSRLGLLRQQAGQAAQQAAEAAQAAATATAALRATLAEAGATTVAEADERLALAAERHRQEAEAAAAGQALAREGDGLSVEELRAEAASHPAESLEAVLAEARAEQQALTQQISEAATEAARLRAERDALHNDDGVAQAAQDQQAAIAQLGQTLEDALLAQVAASLLDAAMGQLQEAGDDALLRRIGAFFAALTEGAYPAVQSREDEKGLAHLVIRRREFPEEDVAVEALSEGTRDQLFLALRLVAIEDQVAGGTTLPFLGDDILQSFDDGRATAAFRTLLDFSETTQVILLSHHRHLAELAAATLPPGALHLQSLESALPLPA
ncbi:AAA family ATPase [Roseomonas sp. ACRSG]|nr:AAA family ATPase [Roseomonas sp. ACRSG]